MQQLEYTCISKLLSTLNCWMHGECKIILGKTFCKKRLCNSILISNFIDGIYLWRDYFYIIKGVIRFIKEKENILKSVLGIYTNGKILFKYNLI